MTLRVVTGGAGTGKTTRLLDLTEQWLKQNAFGEGQRLLALTFMHGSRIRLSERLGASSARGRFDCVTFDGFAREVCRRWRTRLESMGIALPPDGDESMYEETCDAAAKLLGDSSVTRWIAAAHPLVIVDEFQDCFGSRPLLLKHLAAVAHVLVAADPFQDLRSSHENAAMAMLAASGSQPEHLSRVHRTKVAGLLSGAAALRSGKPLVSGPGLEIQGVPTHHVAAGKVCAAIASFKGTSGVVISAGRPTLNSFARKVLDAAAATVGYGKRNSLGPYRVPWETSPDVYRDDLVAVLGLDDGLARTTAAICEALPTQNPLARFVNEWMERERRLRGRTEFASVEIRAQVARAEAAHRALPRNGNGLRALTIHQAKNREFQRVIILWGFTLPGDAEMQRRWLYNAITRAQQAALVIVQDPAKRRLTAPPFTAG